MISCVSKPFVVTKTVYVLPELAFPTFPAPQDNFIIPLDHNYKQVKSDYDEEGNPVEIVYDLIPHWWLQLVLKYKLEIDLVKTRYDVYASTIPPNW